MTAHVHPTITFIYYLCVYFSRMSSKKVFAARVRSEGKITIPTEVRDQLNLQQGELLEVSIHKPEWYELLDWSQMSQTVVNFNALPPKAQSYITTNFSCDSTGLYWGQKDV